MEGSDRKLDRLALLSNKPEVTKIARRDFLTLIGGFMGSAGIAILAGSSIAGKPAGLTPTSAQKIRLPDLPNQNPAFRAWETLSEGLIVWTYKPKREFVGYRLNSSGRQVWRLCNGRKTPVKIAEEYNKKTGRPSSEALDFLKKMMELGIVAAGAYITSLGRFPVPPPGGCFHSRTNNQDPLTDG